MVIHTPMTDTHTGRDERISALMDGSLEHDASTLTVEALTSDRQAASVWMSYHVIGDVLRSRELAPPHSDFDFLARFEERLAKSASSTGSNLPHGVLVEPMHTLFSESSSRAVIQSANAAVFRWKFVASAASAAFVLVLGVGLWGSKSSDDNTTLSSAAAPTTAVPAVASDVYQSDVMIRDARLDALLAAHRELGGHSALQMPAGFLRNATYPGQGR
jgi:sigma-E factor negative regulatory protein RseA